MTNTTLGSVTIVPGAQDLPGLHEREIPQKDQLCGAFWGALALTAAGPYLLVRGVSHAKLDDLARLYLEFGLNTVVPNVIESFRANCMKGVPSAACSVVLVAPRRHPPPPSDTRSVGRLSSFPWTTILATVLLASRSLAVVLLADGAFAGTFAPPR